MVRKDTEAPFSGEYDNFFKDGIRAEIVYAHRGAHLGHNFYKRKSNAKKYAALREFRFNEIYREIIAWEKIFRK